MALKIVKHNEKYAEQAKSEISILNLIKREDPTASKNCIEIKDCFVWRDRVVCLFAYNVVHDLRPAIDELVRAGEEQRLLWSSP